MSSFFTLSPATKRLVFQLLIWKVVVLFFALVAIIWLPLIPTYTLANSEYGETFPYLASIFGNFDGYHYLQIADQGYSLAQVPYFPLYSWTVRLNHQVFGLPWLTTGLLVSHLCFGLAIVVMAKLLKIDKVNDKWFWLVVLTFPTSFFFGATYNDSLFLVLACLCLYFGRQKRWWLAGIFGGLTTLTRLNGLALVAFLVTEYVMTAPLKRQWQPAYWWEKLQEVVSLKPLRDQSFWSWTPIVGGFLAYLVYVHLNSGSWRFMFKAMEVWQQDSITFPPVVIWWYLQIFIKNSPGHYTYWVAVTEFLAVVFYGVSSLWAIGKIRLSYWLFILISILIPWLTGTFAGMPRYGLHLYPLFFILTLWVMKQRLLVKILYFITMLVMNFIIVAFFTRGYFIT